MSKFKKFFTFWGPVIFSVPLLASSDCVSGTSSAAPQAVVFDWGNVLAKADRSVVVDFMCQTFQFSESEFEIANLEKRKAIKAGKSDIEFWLQFATEKGVALEDQWPESYQAILKKSIGADEEMLMIVSELKEKQVSVGLLSNINDKYTKLIRDFGFYDPLNLACSLVKWAWKNQTPKLTNSF